MRQGPKPQSEGLKGKRAQDPKPPPKPHSPKPDPKPKPLKLRGPGDALRAIQGLRVQVAGRVSGFASGKHPKPQPTLPAQEIPIAQQADEHQMEDLWFSFTSWHFGVMGGWSADPVP